MGECFRWSAAEMVERIAKREVASSEVVRSHLDRIEAMNPALNALVRVFRDEALEKARAADEALAKGAVWGPLHGVPITVKECLDIAGVPTTLGCKTHLEEQAATDAVVVRALRAAGAIIIGKTNVPQLLCTTCECLNDIWGRSNNPWSPEHVPGGSSGGESAAIATGMSPWGIGTDLAGSVRVPAMFCGVCGMRPTAHRWSNVGEPSLYGGQDIQVSQTGPIARSAADLALLFRAIDSPMQAALDPKVPPVATSDPRGVSLEGAVVGVYESDGVFSPSEAVRRAVREAARHLEAAGARIVQYEPPHAEETTYLLFRALSSDGLALMRGFLGSEKPKPHAKGFLDGAKAPGWVRTIVAAIARSRGEQRFAAMVDAIGRKKVETVWLLEERRAELRRIEQERWREAGLAALICPVHATPAPPHGLGEELILAASYSIRYSLLNMPAGSVPVSRVRAYETERPETAVRDKLEQTAVEIDRRSEGLPVGVQVVGPHWQESIVLACMQAIEAGARQVSGYPATPLEMGALQEQWTCQSHARSG